MTEIISQFLQTLGTYLPSALAALGILIGGWILALIAAGITRRLVQRTRFDRRLASILGEAETEMDVAHWTARAVYYLILLFVIVGVLQALNLGVVAEPINRLLSQVLSYLPRLVGAGALLLIAWFLATALKFIIGRVFKTIKLDERLSIQADFETTGQMSVSESIGNVVYWLVFVLFLPAVLGALGLRGLLVPVQNMIDEVLGALPDIFGAALILLLGAIAVAAALAFGLGSREIAAKEVNRWLQRRRSPDGEQVE